MMVFGDELRYSSLFNVLSRSSVASPLYPVSLWDASLSEGEGASLRRWHHTAAMARQSSSRKDMLSVRINHRAHHRKQIPLISNATHESSGGDLVRGGGVGVGGGGGRGGEGGGEEGGGGREGGRRRGRERERGPDTFTVM